MNDSKAALRAIAYVVTYGGGLVALAYLLDRETYSGDVLMAAAAGWSLAWGLATVRYEALLVPVGVLGTLAAVWLGTADSLVSYDSGPVVLLFYPFLFAYALAVLALPMGLGIVVVRFLQPERAARSESILAAFEERRD